MASESDDSLDSDGSSAEDAAVYFQNAMASDSDDDEYFNSPRRDGLVIKKFGPEYLSETNSIGRPSIARDESKARVSW